MMKLKEYKECMKDVIKLDVEISLETAKIIYDNLTQKTYTDKSMDEVCELFLFAVYLKKLIDKKETEIFNENEMKMNWDKLADFMLDYNGNDTTDILTTLYENYKRGFPSFTQSLFEEQKLRNSVFEKEFN